MSSSKFQPKGYLEIWKVFDDGSKEIHWSDNNVITSGIGVGLSMMFAASGSSSIKDYQIGYFQVGTSGDLDYYNSSFYELSGPLASSVDYGVLTSPVPATTNESSPDNDTITQTDVVDLYPLKNGSISVTEEPFVKIRYSNVHRVSKNSVRYTLVLAPRSVTRSDKLSEVGLFMRNPLGAEEDSPILVAYRPFTPIQKTDAFTLVFLWTIQF